MNVKEVIKYSRYGYDIVKKMDKRNEFRTIIINCKHPAIQVIRFDKRIKFSINGYTVNSMSDAIKKAIEIYLSRPHKSFITLEKALLDYNNNHNGLQTIISQEPMTKSPFLMEDANGIFYVTTQWSYKGYTANFQEIMKFFKLYHIQIDPIYEVIQ